MSARKWLVRTLVFSVLGVLATAGVLYERWTNPSAVRRQVLEKLSVHFPGADIHLASAHLRLLGGIAVNDLRLSRRGDPNKIEFASVPSAVIFHDKEQLLEGKLAVRKIELYRPRLRIQRGPDGRWNLEGVFGVPHPEQPIPTVVIQSGTILFEDRRAAPDSPPLEIQGVNLTLVNDPLATVNFKGRGISDLAGTLEIKGTWQRPSGETRLSVQAGGMTVGPPLLQRLAAYAPELTEQAGQLEGNCDVQAEIAYYPGASQPWTHDIRLQLSGGKFNHPQIPLPLDHLETVLHCVDGQVTLEKLTAQAGEAQIEVHKGARLQSLSPDSDFQGILEVKHLPVNSKIFEGRLPPNLQKINAEYSPMGPVSLTWHVKRASGQWYKRFIIHPEDLAASFWKFPYQLEHITGTLDQEMDTLAHVELLKVDLVGYAGAERVYIKGQVRGEGPAAAVELKIWGNDLVVDEKLRGALPPVHQKLAESFHPTGRANFEAFIHRAPGSREFSNRYVIFFHDAGIRYDAFPYPLEHVSVLLDIQPDHWQYRDFYGKHQGCEVWSHGRSYPGPQGDRLAITIGGQNMPFDRELAAAVNSDLKQAWKVFQPAGRLRKFFAKVNCLPQQPPDVDVTVEFAGCSIRPTFFPYLLTDLRGRLRYARGWVVAEKISARHGKSVMTLDKAETFLKPGGGVRADLTGLGGSPLMPDNDWLIALPPALGRALVSLQLKDAVVLKTRLTVDTEEGRPPVVFWDGEMALQDATLAAGVVMEHVTGKAACRGRYNGQRLEGLVGNFLLEEVLLFRQPFRNVHSQIIVQGETPSVLRLPNIEARLFGGDVGGEARIEFGSQLHYEINLTAAKIELGEFGRRNLAPGTPLSGLAAARLYLVGTGPDLNDLSGRGSVDVPNGHLYDLPLLLDLLKVLGLRRPDGTMFEEAHADFTIRGPRVVITRFDLYGNSFSLRGQGEMNLDGSDVNLDFYAVWARALQMLPPIIKDVPTVLSQYLLKIKMRGRIGAVRCTKEPVPVLVDPIKELLERMSGRGSAQPAAGVAPRERLTRP